MRAKRTPVISTGSAVGRWSCLDASRDDERTQWASSCVGSQASGGAGQAGCASPRPPGVLPWEVLAARASHREQGMLRALACRTCGSGNITYSAG